MNQEIKQKWVDALRSGKYEQGRGFLRVGDKFCCLGVLCDLYMVENGGKWEATFNGQGAQGFYTGGADSRSFNRHLPTRHVRNWAELNESDPHISDLDVELSVLNDGMTGLGDKSFDDIADLIEDNL